MIDVSILLSLLTLGPQDNGWTRAARFARFPDRDRENPNRMADHGNDPIIELVIREGARVAIDSISCERVARFCGPRRSGRTRSISRSSP